MKRYIVCLLLCVLCLHACASRPQPSVQPQASVKTTTTATTTSTTQPAVLEVYHAVTMTETETDVPVQTVSRAAETSQQAETVTTAAPRTTAAVSETSKAAETTTKRTHLLKMPEHVTQTTAAKTTAAASSASSTATTKTVTTTAATTTTTTAYKGGSVVPLQTVPSGTAAQASYCTITISCGEIRDNPDKLKKPEKLAFVPQDGYILHNLTVSFTPGETVYDVLRRVCETHVCAAGCTFCTKDGKIQMESSFTPVYDSYYVEGIHQIYEKDCGGTSGWTYYVNGTFPHVGSSQYTLSSGDRVEWVFSIEKDGIE